MKKSVEEFKHIVKEKNITRWNIHRCNLCGYSCGYVVKGDDLYYDNGCFCSGGETLSSREWEDLADHYNRNAGSPDAEERSNKYPGFVNVIKEMNAFWGFENPAFLAK